MLSKKDLKILRTLPPEGNRKSWRAIPTVTPEYYKEVEAYLKLLGRTFTFHYRSGSADFNKRHPYKGAFIIWVDSTGDQYD